MNPVQTSILLVEDDLELAQWTRDYLHAKGFQVTHTASGQEAVQRIRLTPPDLVILDGMLPDLDGLDVCREVRAEFHGPIIMLTARDEEIDEVLGLEVGADDYMTKPVRARALLARIRGLLRRYAGQSNHDVDTGQVIQVADLCIDQHQRSVTRQGRGVTITSHEFDVLWILAQQAGNVVSRDALVQALRGFDYDGFDRSIDLRVSRLRKKLGDDPNDPRLIKTVWGKGYLLVKGDA